MLTGESQLHTSTPLVIEPGSLMTGSKWVVVYWTSETWFEYSEIAGSTQKVYRTSRAKGSQPATKNRRYVKKRV